MVGKNWFSKNLKYLREQRGETQLELSTYLGKKSLSSVSDWERGKTTPNAGTLARIAERYGVSIDDLVETDLQNESGIISPDQLNVIPIVGKVAAGEPNYTVEDIVGYMTSPPDQSNNKGLIYLEVSSDSMDKQFPVGSYVLVDTKVTIENGDVAVVKVNGEEATLKQVKFDHDNKTVFLIPNSHNENYFPQIINTSEEEIYLVGKVVGMYQSL